MVQGFSQPAAPAVLNQGGEDSPSRQVHLRSYLDLSRTLQIDAAVYYAGSLAALGIPGYTRLDTRLGWRPTRDVEFSLGLQNLLNDRHAEFLSEVLVRKTEIGRSAYGKVAWRF